MSLFERAARLEAEADRLLERLDLGTVFGWPEQVIGSVRSGLLAVRDLDVTFDAPEAAPKLILDGLAILAERVEILAADFRDERGDRRPTTKIIDERFYLVLRLGNGWKVDLTFWLHVVDRPHVAEALTLRRLPREQRETILRLKAECPDYPDRIGGSDIYRAVLERGVRTVAELNG